jgi:hypothetical protein
MTLQGLSKYLDKYDSQVVNSSNSFEPLKDLPFYNWSDTTDDHTFNHAIGLPQNEGQPMPLFDYEQLLYNALQSNKHIWIKKATGLGVTEFMLRYMAWLCLSGSAGSSANVQKNILSGSQMCIVTGPRIELAITLIDRMKALFRSENLVLQSTKFDTKETVIELNGCHIEAYPSHHLDAMRGGIHLPG